MTDPFTRYVCPNNRCDYETENPRAVCPSDYVQVIPLRKRPEDLSVKRQSFNEHMAEILRKKFPTMTDAEIERALRGT